MAGEQADVLRYVVVSIIGVHKATAGYGAAKLAHEQAVLGQPGARANPAGLAVPRAGGRADGPGPAGR